MVGHRGNKGIDFGS